MKFLCMLILMVGVAATAHAEFPFKKKPQEFTTHQPSDVAEILRNGTPVQRNDLALELDILAPNPSSATTKPNAPCVTFARVDQRPVTLRAGAENVVLLADSSECDSIYVVIFDRAPKSEWRHVQTLRLPTLAQRPEIMFAELIQAGVSEILVRREGTRYSGTVQQQDFVVLKMLHDRIEVVLDATEHSEITLANRSAAETDIQQQTQTSTFSYLRSAPSSGAIYRVLEKETLTDNKASITRYRVWTWDSELERFRPAPFDGGYLQSVPAKKPAAKPAEAAQPQKPAPKPN